MGPLTRGRQSDSAISVCAILDALLWAVTKNVRPSLGSDNFDRSSTPNNLPKWRCASLAVAVRQDRCALATVAAHSAFCALDTIHHKM